MFNRILSFLGLSKKPTPPPLLKLSDHPMRRVLQENWPTHGNFWPDIKDPFVLRSLDRLLKPHYCFNWPMGDSLDEKRSRTRQLELGRGWWVEESDDCLGFTDLTFYCRGVQMFTVHAAHGEAYRCNRDIEPIFMHELSTLINIAVAKLEHEKTEKENKKALEAIKKERDYNYDDALDLQSRLPLYRFDRLRSMNHEQCYCKHDQIPRMRQDR